MKAASAVVAFACAALLACGGTQASSPTGPSPTPAPAAPPAPALPGLRIIGDPEASDGARWTLQGSVNGVMVDLAGILLKPIGAGPFAAVLVSHGLEQAPSDYGLAVAREMRSWGMVAIAPAYTHALGGPTGAPGGGGDFGASDANVQRAVAALAVLNSLTYVDGTRLAAHGHSAGAFVTTALLAAYPGAVRVASHTAGGVDTGAGVTRTRPPTPASAAAIRTPYQLHHGDRDSSVPLSYDEALYDLLLRNGSVAELVIHRGGTHDSVEQRREMFDGVRAWYRRHGVLPGR